MRNPVASRIRLAIVEFCEPKGEVPQTEDLPHAILLDECIFLDVDPSTTGIGIVVETS
jgi:hypothetical protein